MLTQVLRTPPSTRRAAPVMKAAAGESNHRRRKFGFRADAYQRYDFQHHSKPSAGFQVVVRVEYR